MLNFRAIILIVLSTVSNSGVAAITNPAAYERLEADTKVSVREKINPLLEKYCGKFCQLVNIKVEIGEEAPISDDIGFEGIMGTASQNQLLVRKIVTEIQIDNRVSSTNQERLGKILEIHLRSMTVEPHVQWLAVDLPQIRSDDLELLAEPLPQPLSPPVRTPRPNTWNQQREVTDEAAAPNASAPATPFIVDETVEALTKNQLEARLMQAVTKVTDRYCPDQCIIERVAIDGQMIAASDARGYPATQIFKASGNSSAALRIEGIEVDVTIADAIDEVTRDQIVSLMRSHVKFVQPLNLNVSVTSFPETYAQKKDRSKAESEDPYGLERLRQMLVMFRDLAGTKEIITNNTSTNTSESKTASDVRSTSSSETNSSNRESSTNSTSNSNNTTNSTQRNSSATNTNNSESGGLGGAGAMTTEELAAYGAGFILLITLMALAIVKFSRANRDASDMLMVPGMAMPQGRRASAAQGDEWAVGGEGSATASEGGAAPSKATSFSLGMKIKEMKDELLELFLENPKVAKDTFSRFLKEDGVEETAKYVHVFGHLVIFQLLEDPNFQRELYDLSEYYHNSSFRFTQQEEFDLLAKLKTRCTASEIRVLTRKELEKFDFLTKLDPSQIYTLVQDENLQVQSIVLAQLDPKRRRSVFDMYHGPMKIKLLSQLSASEAIPKEFMANVAKALAKKVSQKPEYDTENLRSSDVLLDLLEKAKLSEQRQLMATLQKQNPDTARSLKVKLVTVEMMPILKDGHLLELILGMDRRDLLVFLAGTGEHIRDLLLRKAPEELSDSWIEDLQSLGSVDEQSYRMVEMKVLNRIRNLANNGVISLMDINSMLFDGAGADTKEFRADDPGVNINNQNFVAA